MTTGYRTSWCPPPWADSAADFSRPIIRDGQFYFTAAMWSLAVGAVAGFVAQYAVLMYWGSTEDLPEFLAVALVPGVKYSHVYIHFDQNRRIMLACDEQLARITAKEKLTKAQIRIAHNAVVMKLRAVASLEDFSHARLLDLAEEELSRIGLCSSIWPISIGQVANLNALVHPIRIARRGL